MLVLTLRLILQTTRGSLRCKLHFETFQHSASAMKLRIMQIKSELLSARNLHAGALIPIILSLCTVFGCSKQKQAQALALAEAPKSLRGSIKGRVFLITGSGDLKPARLASVYLLAEGAPLSPDSLKIIESARQHCFQAERWEDDYQRYPEFRATVSGERAIRGALADYANDLSALDKLFGSQAVFAGQADEEGQFTFEQIAPGSYAMAAFGQAGINLAYWEKPLQVTAENQSDIKLNEPVTACSEML